MCAWISYVRPVRGTQPDESGLASLPLSGQTKRSVTKQERPSENNSLYSVGLFKVKTRNGLTGNEECCKLMPHMTVEMRAKIQTTYLPSTSRERCHYAKLPGSLRNSWFWGVFPKLQKRLLASCLSVSPHGTTRVLLDGFSYNLIFELSFENLSRKFKFH
jgi:hypothetical protein